MLSNMTRKNNSKENYLEYYQRVYGEFLVERRLMDGKEAIGIFIAQQPAGTFPDEPVSTYNLQLNLGPEIFTAIDLGLGAKEITVKRGDFVIAPAETSANYTIYNKHKIMCLGIPAHFLDNAASDLGINIDAVENLLVEAQRDTFIRQLIKECWAESNSNLARGALFMDANLMMLASRILKLAVSNDLPSDSKSGTSLGDTHFDRICQYADSNIDTSLRIKSLAALVDMNEYTFSRAFKARTKQSPYQWVIDRRLSRAEILLKKSKMTLAEIAFAVGFSSQSHMTTLFSQRMGATPASFREAL